MSKITKSAITLVTNVLTRAKALGLTVERDLSNDSTLPETASGAFAFVRVDGGTAAMIIPLEHKGGVRWCDLHIDWSGKAGYVPLDSTNGAVVCRVDPSKVDLDLLLTSLSGASKRDRKATTKTASKATSEMLAALKTLGMEPDPTDDSEEDVGEFTGPADPDDSVPHYPSNGVS